MKIIGLDLSLTATGVALPTGNTLCIRPKMKGDKRLTIIRDTVRVAARNADLAVIEDLPTHAYSAGITGMVHGVVRTALIDEHVPYVLVPPATLKKYATGRGNCDKAAMIMSAYKRTGREFTDDNEADAFWLRCIGLDHFGELDFAMPQAQREAMGKVAWI